MRRLFPHLWALVLASTLIAPAGAGSVTAKAFLGTYDDADDSGKTYLRSIATATEDGMGWIAAAVTSPPYCLPPKLGLTGDQIIAIVRQAVTDFAPLGDQPFGLALMIGLKRTFPCQSK